MPVVHHPPDPCDVNRVKPCDTIFEFQDVLRVYNNKLLFLIIFFFLLSHDILLLLFITSEFIQMCAYKLL